MSLTRYEYADVAAGFFDLPTDDARRLIPSHLEPVEHHHGTSVMSATVFDFTSSEVGAYGEVVLAVLVAPWLPPGERLPRSAFFPFRVGTTTECAREHGRRRWHLPHYMEDLSVELERVEGRFLARVSSGGRPALELCVHEHSWDPVSHLYQSFMVNDTTAYLARVHMDGLQSEHEDERGHLRLFDHPFCDPVSAAEVGEVPFREIWMRQGVQSFEPLVSLQPAA